MTDAPNPGSISRSRRAELAIVLTILIGSGVWAAAFWNEWVGRGGKPEFYQLYFEPSVMVACGKGFGLTNPQLKPVEDFVQRRRDRFDCSELPPDLKLDRQFLYQAAWTYLLYTVGLFWRVFGISWSGMAPLFGLFFGAVSALVYAIFRLGMGRALAVLCTIGVATSSLHLVNLPHLRDYSKAPFTLALILIVGVLVAKPLRRTAVLALAAAYGAVLGFGYGFRTDLLIDLPVIVIALFGFLPGGLSRNLLLKGAATVAFVVAFAIVSYPITSAVYERGGCQWHVALLGLQSPFEQPLRLTPAPYDFGYAYADGYVIRGVQGFAHRTNPQGPTPIYCSREYDIQSGRLVWAIVTSFPADLVTRAYASIRQIVNVPFTNVTAPVSDWMRPVFAVRGSLASRAPWGARAAALAILFTSVIDFRLGLFLIFFLAYFGGYPATQFQDRHYFHLEFIGWWAAGFVIEQSIERVTAWRAGRRDPELTLRRVAIRSSLVLVVVVGVFGGLLVGTRWYQTRQAARLFDAYLTAPKAPLEDPFAPLAGVGEREWPQFIEVDLNEAACGPRPAVTFRYDPSNADGDFTRTITIGRRAGAPGTTRVILPVFERYTGLELSDRAPGCFTGAYRFTNLSSLPLLLGVTLPPDWQSRPLYQRLSEWEGE